MMARSQGLSGAQVYGNATLTITPRKSSYALGEVVQLDFYAPNNIGWMVIQRNMWNGMDTGHNIDGTRGWATYLDRVIGPDGHYRLTQPMGLGNIGVWQWDFQLAISDPNDQLHGGDEHSGLKWMKISGSPWEFSVQGDPRIPPGQDFTSAFTQGGIAAKDYQFYASQHTGQSMDSVLIPRLMIENHMIADKPSDYDAAVQQQANEADPWKFMRKQRDELTYNFARGVLDGEYHRQADAGATLNYSDFVNTGSPVWAASEKVYRAGLAPLGPDGYQLRNSSGTYITYDMLNSGDPAAAGLHDVLDTGYGGVYQRMTTADAAAAVASLPSGRVKQELTGMLPNAAPVATTGAVTSVSPIAPSTATASVANSATAAIHNFTSQINSALPPTLTQTVSVGGTSVPYWALGAAAVAVLFFMGDRK